MATGQHYLGIKWRALRESKQAACPAMSVSNALALTTQPPLMDSIPGAQEAPLKIRGDTGTPSCRSFFAAAAGGWSEKCMAPSA
eukprot:CAMPEP_0203865696 /NCGR_PEP_ID=MMETSP0359-20131031/15501_1 /ASSEMBLY_ACC=CAM_ASM_000338 /TAXON_ID=268821 /ORGANISM="Scrippsiella Hangoei, Strain SHTV-5" /LENGTH=83 /DNA_ID=CAMNT_0050783645 /DNA_START=46 /DNA_END=294 /DNA_ORIENTATION=+